MTSNYPFSVGISKCGNVITVNFNGNGHLISKGLFLLSASVNRSVTMLKGSSPILVEAGASALKSAQSKFSSAQSKLGLKIVVSV